MVQYPLRMDESLKIKIEEIAKKEKRSFNSLANKIFEDFIDNYTADQRKNQKRIRVNLEDL